MTEQIVFYILAAIISIFSVLAVTSKKVIRAATYLLFVLLATAGLFLMLNYHFLFAVQIMVYAGGIMVLFIMAIFLTHRPGTNFGTKASRKMYASAALAISGLVLTAVVVARQMTQAFEYVKSAEINMNEIGMAMLGTGKNQYLLPFEVISVMLLACIVGAILIARKEPDVEGTENDLDK